MLSHAIWGLFWTILIQNYKNENLNKYNKNRGGARLLRPLGFGSATALNQSKLDSNNNFMHLTTSPNFQSAIHEVKLLNKQI